MNLCPECAQGKPRNCIGWTLDLSDEEVPCHGIPERGPTPTVGWVDEASQYAQEVIAWRDAGCPPDAVPVLLSPTSPSPDLDPGQRFG